MLTSHSADVVRAAMRFIVRMVQSAEPHAVVEAFAIYVEHLQTYVMCFPTGLVGGIENKGRASSGQWYQLRK